MKKYKPLKHEKVPVPKPMKSRFATLRKEGVDSVLYGFVFECATDNLNPDGLFMNACKIGVGQFQFE